MKRDKELRKIIKKFLDSLNEKEIENLRLNLKLKIPNIF